MDIYNFDPTLSLPPKCKHTNMYDIISISKYNEASALMNKSAPAPRVLTYSQ